MQTILDRLFKISPVPSMVRMALENILAPEFVDGIFRSTQVTFSGLTGNVNSAGIHGATFNPGTGTAGRITPALILPGFPVGVTSGAYDQTFNMLDSSSYSNSFFINNSSTPSIAFNSFLAAAAENKTYFNINTTAFGGGEVRGFLTAVPEPSSLITLAIGGMGVLFARRKRKIVA